MSKLNDCDNKKLKILTSKTAIWSGAPGLKSHVGSYSTAQSSGKNWSGIPYTQESSKTVPRSGRGNVVRPKRIGGYLLNGARCWPHGGRKMKKTKNKNWGKKDPSDVSTCLL